MRAAITAAALITDRIPLSEAPLAYRKMQSADTSAKKKSETAITGSELPCAALAAKFQIVRSFSAIQEEHYA